jgi:hypothetical protein
MPSPSFPVVLEGLGEIFWLAAVMAEMANLTLRELDRVYSNVADVQSRRHQQSNNPPNTGKYQSVTSSADDSPDSSSAPAQGIDPSANSV